MGIMRKQCGELAIKKEDRQLVLFLNGQNKNLMFLKVFAEIIQTLLQDDESQEIKNIFRPLQVLSACTAALAHGGNDVGNAIGPLVLIWLVFEVS